MGWPSRTIHFIFSARRRLESCDRRSRHRVQLSPCHDPFHAARSLSDTHGGRNWLLLFVLRALAVSLCGALHSALAATVEQAWQQVIALDAGPATRPSSDTEARTATLRHLGQQESALRAFLAEHGKDSRAFEAQLRLSRLLQIRGDLTGDVRQVAEAARLLEQLDNEVTAAQRPELDFAKISYLMRTFRPSASGQRERLLEAARRFQSQHPNDRRVAPLLAEVAVLFEREPQTMRALLDDAQKFARTPQLKAQIADGLRRVQLLGQPLKLRWPALNGKPINLEEWRGNVGVLVFFAVWSPPSVAALETVRSALATLPADSIGIVAISLDAEKPPLQSMLSAKKIVWPIGFDGQGWESSLVRALGINALPTVWLVDKAGRLRSLNGLEDTAGQIRQLMRER